MRILINTRPNKLGAAAKEGDEHRFIFGPAFLDTAVIEPTDLATHSARE